MSSYIIPGRIRPKPIRPGLTNLEDIEAIIAEVPCAILPVSGDCLAAVDVVDGGWVAVDFTRRPAPPRLATEAPISASAMPRSLERLALRSCIRSIRAYGAPGRW